MYTHRPEKIKFGLGLLPAMIQGQEYGAVLSMDACVVVLVGQVAAVRCGALDVCVVSVDTTCCVGQACHSHPSDLNASPHDTTSNRPNTLTVEAQDKLSVTEWMKKQGACVPAVLPLIVCG